MADSPAPRVRAGLLGHGIGASRTPRMHSEEGRAQQLDYEYRIHDFSDMPEKPELGGILSGLQAQGLNGLNVTHPYKQKIIPYLDRLSETADAVGAVNTIVFRDGQRFGHNTDCWGFAESFRRGLPNAKRDAVLLIGAGGAGAAVAHALLDSGVGKLFLHDRHTDAAERLSARLGRYFDTGRILHVSDPAEAMQTARGLVNATPVGMKTFPGLPLAAELISPRHWVADIVYLPLETELLATARSRGCRVLPGSGMAVFQAVRAFELFTGLKPDPDRMKRTFDSFTGGANT